MHPVTLDYRAVRGRPPCRRVGHRRPVGTRRRRLTSASSSRSRSSPSSRSPSRRSCRDRQRPRRPRPLRLGVRRVLPRQPGRHRRRRPGRRPPGPARVPHRARAVRGGLCVGGLAPTMVVLVVARACRARRRRRARHRVRHDRPRLPVGHAATGVRHHSTAWVVPGLIGPASRAPSSRPSGGGRCSSACCRSSSWPASSRSLPRRAALQPLDVDAQPSPDRRLPVFLIPSVGLVLLAVSGSLLVAGPLLWWVPIACRPSTPRAPGTLLSLGECRRPCSSAAS